MKLKNVIITASVALLVGALAGYSFRPEPETTTTTTTTSTSSGTSTSTSSGTAAVEVKYINQATLRQDQNSDCTEDFHPETGKLLRRRCVTKTITDSGSTTSGGSTSTTTNNSTNTSTNNSTATNTTNTTNTTTTSTTTKPAPKSKWGLSLEVGSTLLDGATPRFESYYGASLSHKLIGPTFVSLSAYTDKTAEVSLGVDWKRWSISAGVGTSLEEFDLAYGGAISYRLMGPLYVGVWGDSDVAFGVAASLSVR